MLLVFVSYKANSKQKINSFAIRIFLQEDKPAQAINRQAITDCAQYIHIFSVLCSLPR